MLRFLTQAIKMFRKELCCQVQQESGDLLRVYREELFQRLLNERFSQAVQRALAKRDGMLCPERIIKAALNDFLKS